MDCRLDDPLWVFDLCCDVTGVDPVILEKARKAAIALIDRFTCYRYGLCEVRVFPCRGCRSNCGRCADCVGERIDLLPLVGRVESIVGVEIGGVGVPSNTYQLTSHRFLLPYVGSLLYPIPFNNMNLPAGSPGTWSVTLLRGEPIPADVLFAGADLVCQFVSYCLDLPCDIPSNAISVEREGIVVKLGSGLDLIPSIKMLREFYDCSKRRSGLFDPANFPNGKVPS